MDWPSQQYIERVGQQLPNGGVHLRYFDPSEFRAWWPYMSTVLLGKLDEWRHHLGQEIEGVRVMISPAHGALGRHDGPDGTGQHNVDRWGEVRAVDVIPYVGARGLTREELAIAHRLAVETGFTGVGLYPEPEWGTRSGLHLDVRAGTHVAQWSRVGGQYVGVGAALA